MTPFDVLREFFKGRATISDDEFALMQRTLAPRVLKADDFLLRAGDVATHAAFIAHGCLRSYTVDQKGKEHIVSFAPETYWLADATSWTTRSPSQYFFQAIEDSEVLLLDGPGHDRLLAEVPGYAASFRSGLQKHAAAKDRRIVSAMSASAEERYLEFLKTYPSIVTRVPQWMLASYLGISPETLSRIRKHLSRPKRGRRGAALPGDENQTR
jgi:CRP-like cAMP-binding protein